MTLPANSVLFINVGVIALLVLSLIYGYMKGILMPVLNTLGILASILICFMLSGGLSELIQIFPAKWAPFKDTILKDVFYGKINALCWFLVLFVICLIVMAVVRPIFKSFTELPVLKTVNRVLGAIINVIPACIIIVLVTFLLNTVLFTNGKEVVENSVLRYTDDVTSVVTGFVSDAFKENVAIQKMVSDPLSLNDEDIANVIEWLKGCNVSSEDISNFLSKYGIDVKKINELIGSLEE